jgi:proteic killer suppression protein
MIKSFQHRGLKRLFELGDTARIPADTIEKIEHILAVLDLAKKPEHLHLPGFRLHPLKGDLRGFWAVTVRANWRIIWRFEGSDTADVNLIDYH